MKRVFTLLDYHLPRVETASSLGGALIRIPLPFSADEPNDKANTSDEKTKVKSKDRPIDNYMALGPIAKIAIG
jgi:hypothetical protein